MRRVVLCAIVLLLFSVPALAYNVFSIEATDDNFVRGGSEAGNVQDANSSLVVKGDSNAFYRRKSYVKFDLSAWRPDAEASATFTFALLDNSGDGTGSLVEVFGLDPGFTPGSGILGTNWAESAITWNNAPANDTGGQQFTSAATYLADVWMPYSTPAGTAFSVTVPRLGDYLQADDTVTMLIAVGKNSSGSVLTGRLSYLDNSENDAYPGPQLAFTHIPEPASLSLLALGGLALLRRRKR